MACGSVMIYMYLFALVQTPEGSWAVWSMYSPNGAGG